MIFDITGFFPRRFENSTVSLLCPYSAQDYADNTDNWKDAKLPYFTELVDFSVSYWLFMLYGKNGILFPDDFMSLAYLVSISSAQSVLFLIIKIIAWTEFTML